MSGCEVYDKEFGMVSMFGGQPRRPNMVPRSVLGPSPSGLFESHKINGVLIMDSGADFDTNSAFTYLTYLRSRYVTDAGKGDVPFHYFIDQAGTIYSGRQNIIPAELHKDDTFTYRSGELTKQELIMGRLKRRNTKTYNLKGYLVICLLGDYDKVMVNEKQEKALFQLCAYLLHECYIPLEHVKGLHELYPETRNPGFYLRNYLQDRVLEKNIPEPPLKHRFMIPPEEYYKDD